MKTKTTTLFSIKETADGQVSVNMTKDKLSHMSYAITEAMLTDADAFAMIMSAVTSYMSSLEDHSVVIEALRDGVNMTKARMSQVAKSNLS